jgi:hypothetical protein
MLLLVDSFSSKNILMKRIVISLLFLLSFLSAFAQGLKQRLVGTTSNISIVSFVPNTSYTVQFNLASFQGYNGAQVQVGDQYVVEYTLTTPKKAIRFQINTVSVVSGNRVQVTMAPLDGATLLVFPVTTGEVYRPGSGFDLIPIDGSAPMFLEAAIQNHNTIRTDSLLKNHQDSINAILAILGGTGGGSTPLTDSLARTASSNGLTPQFRIPFGNLNGRLDNSVNLQFSGTQLQTLAYLANGTGGNGYFEMVNQSGAPSTPASGFRQFADATGRFSWKPQSDGFIRTFNGALTGDHVYTLPDASGTIGLLERTQTWTGTNTFTGDANKVTGIWTVERAAVSGVDLIESVSTKRWRFGISNNNGTDKTFTLARLFGGNAEPLQIYENGNFVIQDAAGTYNQMEPSAVLNVSSLTKGMLFPRQTTVQRNAISSPVAGLWLYNTTTNRPNYWNGSAWVELSSTASGGFGTDQIVYGTSTGNLASTSSFTRNSTTGLITNSGTSEFGYEHTNTTSSTTLKMVVGSGSAIASGYVGLFRNGAPVFYTDNNSLVITSTVWRIATNSNSLNLVGGYGAGTLGTSIALTPGTFTAGSFTATSGTQTNVRIGGSNNNWQPSSGNATWNMLQVDGNINTSGTYAGVVRGIYYNPVLTSTTGVTHTAIETTSGNVIVGGGGSFLVTNGSTYSMGYAIGSNGRLSLNGTDSDIRINNFAGTTNFVALSAGGVSGNLKLTQNGQINVDLTGATSGQSFMSSSLTIGTNVVGASFVNFVPRYTGTGDLSGAGYFFNVGTATVSNTTTAASGTITSASFTNLVGGILSSVNTGVTYTNAATLRIAGPPTAGTNVTITNPWSLRVESGTSYFGGAIQTVSTFSSVSRILNGSYSTLLWQGDNTGSAYQNNVFNFQSGGLSKGFGFSSNTGSTVFYINTESSALAGVGIGTAISGIAASALLDMQSVSKGFLPPRMSTAQRDAIVSPAQALLLFNSNAAVRYQFYTASAWADIHSSNYAIQNTNDAQRIGNLQLLTSGTASVTGQGIVVTGADSEFQFQGTVSAGRPATFSFDTYTGTPRGFQTTNSPNAFVQIRGGFISPNASAASGVMLLISPTYNIPSFTGATIRGIHYNPTLTNMTGVGTHTAIETVTGDVRLGSTSGRLFLGNTNDVVSDQGALLTLNISASGGGTGFISFNRLSGSNASWQFGFVNGSAFELRRTGDSAPSFSVNSVGTGNLRKDFFFGSVNGVISAVTSFFNLSSGATSTAIKLNNPSTAANSNIAIEFSSTASTGGALYDYAKIEGLKTTTIADPVNASGGLGFFYKNNSSSYTEGFRLSATGGVSIGSTTVASNIAFQVVGATKMSIPAPVMTSIQRLLLTGTEAGMVYSSSSDEYQYFDASINDFVGIVKKGVDGFFQDQSVIFAQNVAGENQVVSSADFRFNDLSGTMSLLAEYSKLSLSREPSTTDLDAALTVKSQDKTSDASYYLRLVKGVDGLGGASQDSVEISMSDGSLLLSANTKDVNLSAQNGIVTTSGSPFVQSRTSHSGSGTLVLSGRQNVAFIPSTATYSAITLPTIVAGTPGTNEVRVGQEITVVIINASSITINAPAGGGIVRHGGSTTPASSVASTGGTTFSVKFTAIDATTNTWSILGN